MGRGEQEGGKGRSRAGFGEEMDIRRRPPTVPATVPPMALAFILSRGVRLSSPPQARTATLRETVEGC